MILRVRSASESSKMPRSSTACLRPLMDDPFSFSYGRFAVRFGVGLLSRKDRPNERASELRVRITALGWRLVGRLYAGLIQQCCSRGTRTVGISARCRLRDVLQTSMATEADPRSSRMMESAAKS